MSDSFTKWPHKVEAALASFNWPLTSSSELLAFIECANATPVAVVAFKFAAAVRSAYEQHWQYTCLVLSFDIRSCLVHGPHAKLDFRLVLWA